jgi:methionyl-tRNA formyltransferase
MRGETTTGVTTMIMDHGVDTGDMLLHTATLIDKTDTAATVHDRLAQMGAELLIQTLEGIEKGTVFPRAQKHDNASYAPMLKKENGRIAWHHSAKSIDALIRAMTPWPGAYCMLDEKRYKIHKAINIDESQIGGAPGTVVPGFPDELRISTGAGVLSILEIQGANSKCLPIKQFLHGNPISPGAVFT